MNKTPHELAIAIAEGNDFRGLNEADTRHKIIDEIIHGVLCWPKKQTFHELNIQTPHGTCMWTTRV